MGPTVHSPLSLSHLVLKLFQPVKTNRTAMHALPPVCVCVCVCAFFEGVILNAITSTTVHKNTRETSKKKKKPLFNFHTLTDALTVGITRLYLFL